MKNKVFVFSTGEELHRWPWHYENGDIGWRELPNGDREIVKYDAHRDDWQNKAEFNYNREPGAFEQLGSNKHTCELTEKEEQAIYDRMADHGHCYGFIVSAMVESQKAVKRTTCKRCLQEKPKA